MKKILALIAILLTPACGPGHGHPSSASFVWKDQGLIFSSPKYGLQVHGLESSVLPAGIGGMSDGTRWETLETFADLGAALDAGVDQLIVQQPTLDPNSIIRSAQSAAYYIVDDYVFWVPDSTVGPTWATGAWQPLTSPVQITLALWSRGSGPALPLNVPVWTARAPGVDGYSYWRWGMSPLAPACAYEIGHFFGIGLTPVEMALRVNKAEAP